MVRIAIDGPGGAGKSSVAKAVARELGIIYVDTGALYRTIALHMTGRGIDPKDSAAVTGELDKFTLELKFIDGRQVILLDGEDVGDRIRTPEISMAASAVSAIPEVRSYLLNTQRSIARRSSVIMDGRDIGTVILPHAEVKIFLTASPEARARRRYDELIAKGQDVTYEKVYEEMAERDRNDSTRAVAPCVKAKDAILLDNSKLTAEGTVKKVIKIIKKRTRKSLYMTLFSLLAAPIRFFQRIKRTGLENIPDEGNFIICSNHIAAKDVFMIASCYPKEIKFIAKKELFSIPLLGSIIKKLGAIELDRSGSDVKAIKKAISLAASGADVAIFPQGHRYPGVEPQTTPTKNGAAMIAYKSTSDVLPVFIKTKNNRYGFLRRIEVIFGKPVKYEELGFKNGGSEEYKAATDIIFGRILELGGYALPSPEEMPRLTDGEDDGEN